MTRKELKRLIKEHKIKQVCSVPEVKMEKLNLFGGAYIMYKYIDKDAYICVRWYWQWSSSKDKVIVKQDISESKPECLTWMHDDIKNMHADPNKVEAVHKLYNECTDIMNSNSSALTTMEYKICAKYVRKACDFFIHDRRFH